MFSSRRSFLGSAFALAASVVAGAQVQGTQTSSPDSNAATNDPYNRTSPASPRLNPRDLLAANQKSIQKDVARLSDIVEQLQKQLEDNDIKDVLPLDVIRETDEIQKLAKHINSLLRG